MWVCAVCDAVSHTAQKACHNCKATKRISKRSNWTFRCRECTGALTRDQDCDCHTLAFENRYRDRSPEPAPKNPWTNIDCDCESAECKDRHYTKDEKERVKRALWTHSKSLHPEGAFIAPGEEACLSMALQCKCKFGASCRFSHDKKQFPVNLEARERAAGKRPPQIHRQDRDTHREAQQPVSRKRGVDEVYSVRGHGIQKTARISPNQPSGKGGYKYASSDVRNPRLIRTNYFPYDPRDRDANGRRVGPLPKKFYTKAEWLEIKRQAGDKRTAEEISEDDREEPYEDEHTDQNMNP